MNKKMTVLVGLLIMSVLFLSAQTESGMKKGNTLTEKQTERVLRKAMKKLNKEFLANKEKECSYVLSQKDYIDGNQSKMMRGILKARSNITPRNMCILSGQCCGEDVERDSRLSLESSNLYHVLQLGPMIAGGEYWHYTQTPFIFWPPRRTDDGMIIDIIDSDGIENAIYNRPEFGKRYDIAGEVVQMPDGNEAIRVILQKSLPPTEAYKGVGMLLPNGKIPAFSILNGTIYIDRKKKRLLSFDGELIGLQVRMKQAEEIISRPASCHVKIEYGHRHGYTEIQKSSCIVKCENSESAFTLFNIGSNSLSRVGNSVPLRGNLPEAIRQAGDNPELWENEAVKEAIKKAEEPNTCEGAI